MRNYLQKRNDSGFGLNFFDDVFEDFFKPVFYTPRNLEMRTDIKDIGSAYELKVDMPGFEKEDINLMLKDGYLTLKAERKENAEENYVRRERNYKVERSYYVGDNLTEDDIKAKYVNGTLELVVNKQVKKEENYKNIKID